LPVYAHARAAEASWMRLLGRLSGVGQRYFSERLPHLRIATDDGRPAAHPRQLSGIVLLGRWFAERLLEVIRMDEKRLWETRWNCSRGHRVAAGAANAARAPRPEKHALDYEEGWESVRGALALKEGGRVDNSRILLLDVMMTGATLNACSRALADAGASSVIAVTVARAVRPASPAGR
jgi:predicted amidophosphoribosyltransferase